jgi:hypothetical protein
MRNKVIRRRCGVPGVVEARLRCCGHVIRRDVGELVRNIME